VPRRLGWAAGLEAGCAYIAAIVERRRVEEDHVVHKVLSEPF
jgi:hypothetical protein